VVVITYLVTISVQDGNYSTRLFRVNVLVRVPSSRSRTSLAFTITNHRDGYVIRLVHDGAVCDGETVAELTTFVDRTGRLGIDLTISSWSD
jgi:hypothetical protein